MFPTVLDVNNIYFFLLGCSITIISLWVKKTTFITNKSRSSLILSIFSIAGSNYKEKIKVLFEKNLKLLFYYFEYPEAGDF